MCFYVLVPFIWLLSPVRDRIIWLAVSAILFLTVTAAVSKMVTGSFYVFDDTYFYYWFPTQAPVMIVGLIFYFLGGLKLQNYKSITHIPVSLSGSLCFWWALEWQFFSGQDSLFYLLYHRQSSRSRLLVCVSNN